MNKLGYCCINVHLSEQGITTNRGMVKKTFESKGLEYASSLALQNVKDLYKIIEWNEEQGIKMYRMSSDIFPWVSEYEIKDLPDYEEIKICLLKAGDLAKSSGQRLTFHPSPYAVIASVNPNVIKKSIKEINQHGEMMDLMGLERSTYYPINIHINTTKPTKEDAARRFCENFNLLDDSAKKRLVVENDDKTSQFTPSDLYNMVHLKIGIPITFDYLHYKCNPDYKLSEEESLKLSLSTWKTTPITHFSDSRKLFEDKDSREVAHSDWIWTEDIPTYGETFDIELEVKMKEQALLKYIKNKTLCLS
jgi:UV DNA damage endonuclease